MTQNLHTNPLFSDDYKLTPYWWEKTPPPELPQQALPEKADVVIVGAGYTGLSAALQTARAGRHTLVIDAENAGAGCSTRNGGQISASLKPKFETLASKYGAERAFNLFKEGHNSVSWLEDFIQHEHIDCAFKMAGRFIGAHNPAQYKKLSKNLNHKIKGLELESYLIPKTEQHTELGTDRYYGGIVFPRCASVDPAALHRGLLDKVIEAGATIIPHCPAIHIENQGSEIKVSTPRGAIRAKDVVVASNGYTTSATPWMRRRIIPIGSYIIATEPLAPDVMDRLCPTDRMLGDTRQVIFYYRPSPDRKRIIFGGRVSHTETNPLNSGPKLQACMVDIFPELAQTKISHSWVGFVAYTFDALPHLGKQDGIYYSMGYCGSGIAMSCYFGMRIAKQLLGEKQGDTAFDNLKFQTRPLYNGKPWFLGASVRYFRWLDSLNR